MLLVTVEGYLNVSPTSAHRIPVRVKGIRICSCALSLPDSIAVQRLKLEGTITTVRDGHISEAVASNVTGSAITLKQGLHLGSFIVLDRSFFQDSPPFVAAVSSQPANTCDPAELATQLETHVKMLDFADARSRLIDLLVTHRQVSP